MKDWDNKLKYYSRNNKSKSKIMIGNRIEESFNLKNSQIIHHGRFKKIFS